MRVPKVGEYWYCYTVLPFEKVDRCYVSEYIDKYSQYCILYEEDNKHLNIDFPHRVETKNVNYRVAKWIKIAEKYVPNCKITRLLYSNHEEKGNLLRVLL